MRRNTKQDRKNILIQLKKINLQSKEFLKNPETTTRTRFTTNVEIIASKQR